MVHNIVLILIILDIAYIYSIIFCSNIHSFRVRECKNKPFLTHYSIMITFHLNYTLVDQRSHVKIIITYY